MRFSASSTSRRGAGASGRSPRVAGTCWSYARGTSAFLANKVSGDAADGVGGTRWGSAVSYRSPTPAGAARFLRSAPAGAIDDLESLGAQLAQFGERQRIGLEAAEAEQDLRGLDARLDRIFHDLVGVDLLRRVARQELDELHGIVLVLGAGGDGRA